jgi:transposase
MSLQPQAIQAIPEETASIAHRAFPQSNLCLRLRDELGPLYDDQMFAPVFSTRSQPAESL